VQHVLKARAKRETAVQVSDSENPCVLRILTGFWNAGVGSTYQCDEYPYASTYEGGEGAWAACIDQAQNSNQGGVLSAFLNERHAGFQVSINFSPSFSFPLWSFLRLSLECVPQTFSGGRRVAQAIIPIPSSLSFLLFHTDFEIS